MVPERAVKMAGTQEHQVPLTQEHQARTRHKRIPLSLIRWVVINQLVTNQLEPTLCLCRIILAAVEAAAAAVVVVRLLHQSNLPHRATIKYM